DRPRLETPVALEGVRARPDLAAPEIERAVTTLHGATHDRPVHDVVRAGPARLGPAARVVGHHAVAEIVAEHAADGLALVVHRQDLAVVAEGLEEQVEISP